MDVSVGLLESFFYHYLNISNNAGIHLTLCALETT
jgi:hypothetical protein